MKLLPAVLVFATLPLTALFAAEAPLQIAERGKSLLSEDFSQPPGKDWKIAKGKWENSEGALRGAEVASDMHPGVTRHELAFDNAILQIELKFDGAKAATISLNDAKGHLARVLLNPAGFSARKDDSDHEGPDEPVDFGRRPVSLKPGEWHQVQIEFIGDTMITTVDGGNIIAGSHETFTKKKANLGFTVTGEFVSYRNLRVWEATPKAGWEQTKAKLVADSQEQAKNNPAPVPAAKGKPAAKAAAKPAN